MQLKLLLSSKYGIGTSTVSDIIKKKASYRDEWEKNTSSTKKRINNEAKYDKLNRLVWDWFCTVRAKVLPVSGPIIQEKALQFAKELELLEFKASNGWLGKWKTRYGIKEFRVCGDSAGVNIDDVNGFKSRIHEFVEGYSLEDIYNCDETGLYFRALPERTLASKGQPTKGFKMSKDRVTVMLTCSATGDKLEPLVIGKAMKPRCFKNVKVNDLKVKYTANKKAWMDSSIFRDWLLNLDKQMTSKGRKIMLLLDNAASHGKVESHQLKSVKVKFLPANTTSHLQPLDQGIIRNFKALYRRYLLKSLVSSMDTSDSVSELCKRVTLLDAVNWIVRSWNDVRKDTITKCFSSVGFGEDIRELDESDCEDPDDDIPLSILIREFACTANDFAQLDLNIETEDVSDNWEVTLVDCYRQDSNDSEPESEDESDHHQSPGSDMTYQEVLMMLKRCQNFASVNNTAMLEKLTDLRLMAEQEIVRQKCSLKQKSISDFFNKC